MKAQVALAAFVLMGSLVFGCRVQFQDSNVNILPEQLPDAWVGQPYEASLSANVEEAGANVDMTFEIRYGELPAGLVLRKTGDDTALITGFPSAAGSYSVTIMASAGPCTMFVCSYRGWRDYQLTVKELTVVAQ